MSDDTPDEIDVLLGKFDMDHLSAGQPVFKQGSGETLLVLRFDEFDEWDTPPKSELRELIEEYREKPFDCVDGAAARDREEQLLEKLEALLDDS